MAEKGKMVPFCQKFQKPCNDITECSKSCSDYADGKPCPNFSALTEEDYVNLGLWKG